MACWGGRRVSLLGDCGSKGGYTNRSEILSDTGRRAVPLTATARIPKTVDTPFSRCHKSLTTLTGISPVLLIDFPHF